MARIVAIGGGEIGRSGSPVETTELDAEVVRLAEKRRPRVLFLPTAAHDDPLYVSAVEEQYGRRLGCVVDVLSLYDRSQRAVDITMAIRSADIVYVGGGNTLRMMKLWRRRGVDDLLREAAEAGTVLAGLSAGGICWCAAGVSDARTYTSRQDSPPHVAVRGMGLVDIVLSPHHSSDARRPASLERIATKNRLVGVGLDDHAALEILDDRWRLLSCRTGSAGHRVDPTGATSELPSCDEFRPMTELFAWGTGRRGRSV